jgi:hypothetical protein
VQLGPKIAIFEPQQKGSNLDQIQKCFVWCKDTGVLTKRFISKNRSTLTYSQNVLIFLHYMVFPIHFVFPCQSISYHIKTIKILCFDVDVNYYNLFFSVVVIATCLTYKKHSTITCLILILSPFGLFKNFIYCY